MKIMLYLCRKFAEIKTTRFILIYLAASITFLHSLLPHQHHGEMVDAEHSEEHVQAEDLLDYLELIFHLDQGEGHLESFDQGKGLDYNIEFTVNLLPDLPAFGFAPLLLRSTQTQCKRIRNYDVVPIPKRDVIAHLDFRGPPFFV